MLSLVFHLLNNSLLQQLMIMTHETGTLLKTPLVSVDVTCLHD